MVHHSFYVPKFVINLKLGTPYFVFTTALLRQITQKPTQEKKQKLTPQSKMIADQVAKLVHAAEALKGELCFGRYPLD